MPRMKAAVFVQAGRIVLDKPVPDVGPHDLFSHQRDGVLKVAITP
ncbi:hypothetical protein [Hansschlegelia sp. KR7-227]